MEPVHFNCEAAPGRREMWARCAPPSDPLPGQTGCSFHSSTFIFFSSIFSAFLPSARLPGCCFFSFVFFSSLAQPPNARLALPCRASLYFPELDLVRCSPTPFLSGLVTSPSHPHPPPFFYSRVCQPQRNSAGCVIVMRPARP